MPLAHLQGLEHWHAPSRARACHVVVCLRRSNRLPTTSNPPPMRPSRRSVRRQAQIAIAAVVLYAKVGDLVVNLSYYEILRCRDTVSHLFRTTDNVERAPSQKTRDRIEIRRIHIAADTSCFKRNRAAATKRISDTRPLAEAPDAEFFHEIR